MSTINNPDISNKNIIKSVNPITTDQYSITFHYGDLINLLDKYYNNNKANVNKANVARYIDIKIKNSFTIYKILRFAHKKNDSILMEPSLLNIYA